MALFTSASMSDSSATSVGMKIALSMAPSSAISDKAALPVSWFKSPITTEAPSARKRSAVARPMPLAPPVITATLPSNRVPIFFSSPLPYHDSVVINESKQSVKRKEYGFA